MRVLKFPVLGLLLMFVFSCQKSVDTAADVAATGKKPAVVNGDCSAYKVELLPLDKSSKPGYTIFTWSIENLNPGNGTQGTTQNLSHWSFIAGKCLEDYWGAVEGMYYRAGDVGNFTEINPTPQIQPDPSQSCTAANVVKFDQGTSGKTKTYYQIVLEGNWGTAKTAAYFKSGVNTGCCTQTIDGVGCPEISDCSLSQGYWFAGNPANTIGNHAWPFALVLGGHTYSNEEGVAIWRASNQGGISDAKKAFSQAAAVILSQVSDAAVVANVQIINNWLATLPTKLSASYLPSPAPANVKVATQAISDYITDNHCPESGD